MSFIQNVGQLRTPVSTYTNLPLISNIQGDVRIALDTGYAYTFIGNPSEGGIDSNTKLLLHLDNNVTDSETTPKTVTNHGATFSSSIKKFGSHAAQFNGTSQYLTFANDSSVEFGSGDFTIDCWVYHSGTNSQYVYGDLNSAGDFYSLLIQLNNPGNPNKLQINISTGVTGDWIAHQTPLVTEQWNHIAMVRQGTEIYAYLNGVKSTLSISVGTNSINTCQASARYIARAGDFSTGFYLNGFIDEFRISKGIARWTSNFTPPTAAYDLIGSLSDWSKISASNFGDLVGAPLSSSLAIDDVAKITKSLMINMALLAFNVAIQYSSSIAKMFDGVINRFRLDENSIDNTASLHEVWVDSEYYHPDNLSETLPTVSMVDSSSTPHTITANGSATMSGANPLVGNASLYLDGTTNTYIQSADSIDWLLNSMVTGGGGIDSFVKTLLHFDNNVTDSETTPKTWTNNGTTFTTPGKFGGYAASFNGTSKYVTIAENSDFTLPTGNYTWDFWMKTTQTASAIVFGKSDSGGSAVYYAFLNATANKIRIYIATTGGSTVVVSTTSVNDGVWHHIAAVVNGSTLSLYVDGILENSGSISGSPVNLTSSLSIGRLGDYSAGLYYSGEIDEFRISKGIARWTSNFTPPTAAYDVGNSQTLSDYTVDLWVNPLATSDTNTDIIGQDGSWKLSLDGTSNKFLKFAITSGASMTGTSALTIGAWTHIAVVQSSSTLKLYVNGVAQATVAGSMIIDSSSPLTIGGTSAGANLFNGFIEEVRISNSARWTTNFTPTTTEYTNDANTKLLLHLNEQVVNNMTLISEGFVANYVPTSARVVVFEEDVNVVEQNVDLTVEVSRDGGTTFSNCILAKDSSFNGGSINLFTGSVSLTSQPNGTLMVYRIKTQNNKDCKIRGVALNWR